MSDEPDEANRIHEAAANMEQLQAGAAPAAAWSVSRAITSVRSTNTTSIAPSRRGRPAGARTCAARLMRSRQMGVRAFIGGLVGAVPDLDMEVVSTTTEEDRCGVQWRLTGTFAGPAGFGGIAPTGARIELEGFDLLTVQDGLIQSNDAFTDSMTFARQIGMMPAQGSRARRV